MTRKEKIQKLKELKYYIIMYEEYRPKENTNSVEKNNEMEKQKVLVLKKSYHGKMLKVG